MKYTNGFFQLDIRINGVYAHIYPAKDGGRDIAIQEFVAYLEKCGIRDYNLSELNRLISKADKEVDVFISSEVIDEVPEMAMIRVINGGMVAAARFYPPSKNGKYMTENDILNELERAKVTYGISKKVIYAYMAGRQFCRDIPIAKGKAVVSGSDAKIIYHFDTAPTSKPLLLEDGSVDFHQLNIFVSVKKGDLLAELIPDKEGTAGVDVFGNIVYPPKVKKRNLKFGKNIKLSDDQMRIFSEVDGDVKLSGETVFVSSTYNVPADVDASTGDIHYNGNIHVAGNVRAGFLVEASGDIEVDGAVEGAVLKAGGNIALKRGVQGMGKGVLQAGNDIITKFLESCTVKAGRVVNTGSSLHSDVTAGETVIVSGKKGCVIGGTVSAGKRIEASVFGNKMNTTTTLKVGVDPEVLERFKKLTTAIKEKQENLLKHRQIVQTTKKRTEEGRKFVSRQREMTKLADSGLNTLEEELEKESAQYVKLKKEIENNIDGRVVVNRMIYPGVCIHISNRVYQVKDVQKRCQFRTDGTDVVSTSI